MQTWAWLVLSTLLALNAVALSLWWLAKREAARLQRRLARAEEARFQMRRDLQALEARLATADNEPCLHRHTVEGDGETAPSEPPPHWTDTQVFDGSEGAFVRTQPGGNGAQAAR